MSAPAESRLGRRPSVPLIQICYRPTAGEASSSLGMLQCIVAADGDSISVEQLSAAVRDSISALIERLPDRLRWAGAPFGLSLLVDMLCRETAARPAVTGGPLQVLHALLTVTGVTCFTDRYRWSDRYRSPGRYRWAVLHSLLPRPAPPRVTRGAPSRDPISDPISGTKRAVQRRRWI